MKILSSLALVSAHNQVIPTIDVIFEWYEGIFDQKDNIFLIDTYFLYKQPLTH